MANKRSDARESRSVKRPIWRRFGAGGGDASQSSGRRRFAPVTRPPMIRMGNPEGGGRVEDASRRDGEAEGEDGGSSMSLCWRFEPESRPHTVRMIDCRGAGAGTGTGGETL